MSYSFGGMFSGGGGLDLGFELAGFDHRFSTDWDADCVATLRQNRPHWSVSHIDVHDFDPVDREVDVLLAGIPCQGFSLGGNRRDDDDRNQLFRQVVRVAEKIRPPVVVVENVLNLRNMRLPGSGKPFIQEISGQFEKIGYEVESDFLKMSGFGVPQTRRRFVLVAFRGRSPKGYQLPGACGVQHAEPFLRDIIMNPELCLPNHDPNWSFPSQVHVATGEPFDESEAPIPVRFSRTASDGNAVRCLKQPFPAVDTATIWGWAQGNVTAERLDVDRSNRAKFVRNREAKHKLWRVSASRLRAFTEREYARLQTFPDDWVFAGATKRSLHMQIGNAVPVAFARRLGENIGAALDSYYKGVPYALSSGESRQLVLEY